MDAIRVRKEFLPIDQAIDQQARQAYAVIDQLETLFRKREYAHLAETQKQREYVAMRKEQIDQTVQESSEKIQQILKEREDGIKAAEERIKEAEGRSLKRRPPTRQQRRRGSPPTPSPSRTLPFMRK